MRSPDWGGPTWGLGVLGLSARHRPICAPGSLLLRTIFAKLLLDSGVPAIIALDHDNLFVDYVSGGRGFVTIRAVCTDGLLLKNKFVVHSE